MDTDVAALRAELEQAALAGEGWARILERLSAASGRDTWLVAVHGGVLAAADTSIALLAASEPASGEPASDSTEGGLETADAQRILAHNHPQTTATVDGRKVRVAPIAAGTRRLGLLVMEEPVDEWHRDLLEAALLPMAIEAVRRDAAAAATAASASQLVDELRYGSLRDPDQVVRTAERFGTRLDRPHAAAVFAYDGLNAHAWDTGVHWIETPVHRVGGLAWTVLGENANAEARRIRRRLEGIVGDAPVLAATGPVVTTLDDTTRSFADAEVVLALLRVTPDRLELSHAALGAVGVLLSVPAEHLAEFVYRWLGPILHRSDLLETLEAWFDANGSRAAVAHRLHVHRNSVGYRIGRVRELLEADPLDPWTGLQLQVALAARRVLSALADLGRA